MAKPSKVGQRVKLTGQFLRSTGQFAGGEGHSTWTVTAIDTGTFPLVTTDELIPCYTCDGGKAPPADGSTCDECHGAHRRNRRIAAANLYVVNTLDSRNA